MSINSSKPNIFGIKYDNGPNVAASPLTALTQEDFIDLYFCGAWGLDGLCYAGWAPAPRPDVDEDRSRGNWYSWYYYFHQYALALAHKYTGMKDGKQTYEKHYYRLGCTHPRMTSGSGARMHDMVVSCPDCTFKATYDSSG